MAGVRSPPANAASQFDFGEPPKAWLSYERDGATGWPWARRGAVSSALASPPGGAMDRRNTPASAQALVYAQGEKRSCFHPRGAAHRGPWIPLAHAGEDGHGEAGA